jgi:hypothetical protein
MTKLEFILKSLLTENLKTTEIVDKYYDECSDDVDNKRRYYISKNKEKTEKELRTQILAEFSSDITRKYNKIYFDKVGDSYTLSEDGKKYYNEFYLKTEDDVDVESEDIDIELTNDEIKEEFNKKGIIYLLKSESFEDVYKIGKTINLDKRLNDLKKDNRYGVFDLNVLMYIECPDYSIIERVFHKFFEDYRLCKKNNIGVDTELFKGVSTIVEEFKLFGEFLQKNPRFDGVNFFTK